MITKTPSLMTALTKIHEEILIKKSKTVCFTSSIAQEGTTTIACAIAEIAASLNQKVLYCDFSDYSTSLSKHFKKKFVTSPKDYLEQAYENIHFIESLGIYLMPPPTELILDLLRKGVLSALFDQFKKDYDLVIIDSNYYSSYTEGVFSTTNLIQEADAVVLVILSGSVTETQVKRTAEKILRDGGKLIGLILNDLNYPKLSDELTRATYHLEEKFPDTAEKLRLWIKDSDFLNSEY